ncbi:MAG: Fic family protein [Rickettsiales bacterium]|nr:Fic family protein [Rickettsiales bacterium]
MKRTKNATSAQIAEYIIRIFPDKSSKITIIRDIDVLLMTGKITKSGRGRATVYTVAIDINDYFALDPDKRPLKSEYYNFNVWNDLDDLFNLTELAKLDALNAIYRKNRAAMTPVALHRELERLTIEFSWKSSKIEGNTYTLLDTERLIKENIEAAGKKRNEAIMILNHKKALDFVFSKPEFFANITLAKIEDLHKLLTAELEVRNGIRQSRVGIIGTNYRPLDNAQQIREALFMLTDKINSIAHPIAKALVAVLMISYIQPFEDGNKRTARLLGNAILLAHNYCPLSYRSADEIEYKKSVILFYEQNDFAYFKTIFAGQFEQTVKKYF